MDFGGDAKKKEKLMKNYAERCRAEKEADNLISQSENLNPLAL